MNIDDRDYAGEIETFIRSHDVAECDRDRVAKHGIFMAGGFDDPPHNRGREYLTLGYTVSVVDAAGLGGGTGGHYDRDPVALATREAAKFRGNPYCRGKWVVVSDAHTRVLARVQI